MLALRTNAKGLLSLLCCGLLLLAGCAPFGMQNMNDLLHAPALGQGQGEVQKALAQHVGEQPEYKYPKEGDWRSPLVMADLDGNGVEEAVLVYALPNSTALDRSTNVYVAVLEQAEGEWRVVQDIEGQAGEVASLDVADLLQDGTQQLIVGYANANLSSKIFMLYQYKGGILEALYRTAYSRYELEDFTGSGAKDLVIVSPDDNVKGMFLQYVSAVDGAFDFAQKPVALGANFVSCVGLYPSAGPEGERLIIADCKTGDDQLSSQIIYYSGDHFFVVSDAKGIDALLGETARANPLLKSQDIDADGIVEIPQRMGKDPIHTRKGDKNLEFVKWMDFTQETPVVRQAGILDSDRGVYIRLPEAWLLEDGQDAPAVRVADGLNEGEWRIEDEETGRTLMRLQILEADQTPPGDALLISPISSAYLTLSSSLTLTEQMQIQPVELG